MAVPGDRLQQLIKRKDGNEALVWCQNYGYAEGWAIIDGVMVVYDLNDPPLWLKPILELQDDDGNTDHVLAGVTPMRVPREGEYDPQAGSPALVPIEA